MSSNEDKELVAVVKSYLKEHKSLAVKLKQLNVYSLQMWICKCCRDSFIKTRKLSGIIIVSRCGHSFIGYQGDIHDINVDKLSSLEEEQLAWNPDIGDKSDDDHFLQESNKDKGTSQINKGLELLREGVVNEDTPPETPNIIEENFSATSQINKGLELLREVVVNEDTPPETPNKIEEKFSGKSSTSREWLELLKDEQNPGTSVLTKGYLEVPTDNICLKRAVVRRTVPINVKVPVDWRNTEAMLDFLECFTSFLPERASGLEDYVDEYMTGFLPHEIKRLEYKVQKWKSYGTKRRKIMDCCYWHAWEENGEICDRKQLCTFCEFTCEDKDEMMKHRRSLHSAHKPFRCKSCPFESFSFECLTKHIRIGICN